jgi:hypothetical protein
MEKMLNLDLPANYYIPFRNESDLYGASHIAKIYTGVKTEKPINGIWNHGCVPDFFGDHPIRFAGSYTPDNKSARYFVARQSQEKAMIQGGYSFVKAIGLPVIYVEKKELERIPGSLLVMPVHSTIYTENDWNFKKYVEQIETIRKYFSKVVVCVHVSCFEKGYWVNEFREKGFEVIQGVLGVGANDHLRLQKLMSMFEYVTTNGFGSHIAYASYYGAKVSIYGEFPIYRRDDFKNDPNHKACPKLLETTCKLLSEENVRTHLREFFQFPKDAIQRIDWAMGEIGYENRISPKEMKELFGWNWKERILFETRKLLKSS